MKIKIVNEHIYGRLEFKPSIRDLENELYYPIKPLYDFKWAIWMDPVLDTIVVCMRGSVISMMQFRKYILLNNPGVLIDD